MTGPDGVSAVRGGILQEKECQQWLLDFDVALQGWSDLCIRTNMRQWKMTGLLGYDFLRIHVCAYVGTSTYVHTHTTLW